LKRIVVVLLLLFLFWIGKNGEKEVKQENKQKAFKQAVSNNHINAQNKINEKRYKMASL